MSVQYYPYGKILREWNPNAEKYLTTHHERDKETGLDYRGARYYDADVARFLSLDPLAVKYASHSSYLYVGGSPILFKDTDGKDIIIWYDDSKGAKKSFNFTGSLKGLPKNDFVINVVNAYFFDTQTGGGDNLKAAALSSDINLQVVETDQFSIHAGGIIYWNPNLGSEHQNGTVVSPATVLEHEGSHGVDYLVDPTGHNNRSPKDEEARAIAEEQKTARCNGEICEGEVTRTEHEGVGVVTKGVSSNEIDGKKTVDFYKRIARDTPYDVQDKIDKYEKKK